MNQFVKRWLTALRSGEYEQGTGALCKDGKYCCLGVACELFAEELNLKVERFSTTSRYSGCTGSLPVLVSQALGLKDTDGSFIDGNTVKSLSSVNDREGKTFKQIADLIESKPMGLFELL